MAVGGEDESNKYFWDREVNVRISAMKYSHLAVFILKDSAEIWGLGMDSHLPFLLKNLLPALVFSCV